MSNLTKLSNLPSLADLYADKEAYNESQEMHALLNQPPKPEWIMEHPQTRMKYIPIGRIEYLLNMLFVNWNVEILNTNIFANSISVTVRLHLTYPTGKQTFFDGVGAAPLQTDKGAGATDFNQIKSAAVQMALPSAKSYAIKDAADHIGNLFGKDLNRKQIESSFFSILEPEPTKKEVAAAMSADEKLKRLAAAILKAKTVAELEVLKPYIDAENTLLCDAYNAKEKELLTAKAAENV